MKRYLFLFVRLIASLGLAVSILVEAPASTQLARAAGNFIVNTSSDAAIEDNFLSLREAMQVDTGYTTGPFSAAEQTQLGGCIFDGTGHITGGCGVGVADTITFAPAITSITLSQWLPVIGDAGTSIIGTAGSPKIDAINVILNNVLTVGANNVTIANLTIVNGTSVAPDIFVAGGINAHIANNFLGVTKNDQTCPLATATSRAGEYGVEVFTDGSSGANNGVAYIYGNTIGCHMYAGIEIHSSDYAYVGVEPDGVTVNGNYIGTNSSLSNLANGTDGVLLDSSSTGTRLDTVSGNTIAHNNGAGVHILGTGSNNTSSSYSNFIRGNTISANLGAGVSLESGAYLNWIGGLTLAQVNLISGNQSGGITALNSDANVIVGNLIDSNGQANLGAGINLFYANNSTISVNNISNSYGSGVHIDHSNSNHLTFNSIGTNFTIDAAAPNKLDGVIILNSSQNNIIGGQDSGNGNFISGNLLCGVRLANNADNNTVQGNYIGLNWAGNAAIPNGDAGVCIEGGSDSNLIGGAMSYPIQVISGNKAQGVSIQYSDGNRVAAGNLIGLSADSSIAIGNGKEGVLIANGNNNIVVPWKIEYNGGAGVAMTGNGQAYIEPAYFIGFNGGIPIDLGNDGFTPNDPGDADSGPNGLLNYPEITSATGDPLVLLGTVCQNCWVHIYTTVGNPALPGGNAQLIGQVLSDPAGNWTYTLPAGMKRFNITLLTVTAGNVESSEFAPNPVIFLPVVMNQ